MDYKELRDRILAATDDGKQIMDDYLPEVIIKGNINKKFSIREGDDTPSAHLYPPNPKYKDPGWHVKDFGGKWY